MKKMKFGIILAAAAILGLSAGGAYAASDYGEAYDIMTGLYLSEKYDGKEITPADEMSRGEFVYRINVFDRGIDKKTEFSVLSPYLDVDMEYEYYNDIAHAANAGYISTKEDKFYPERIITVDEAASVAVRRLGYEANAEARGGFPRGYRYVANQLGLLKGVTGVSLTRENSIRLLYNMTLAYSQEVTSYSGGDNGFVNYDKTEVFLEETLGIYRAEGTVQAIGNESLNDEKYDQNQIIIDGSKYKIDFARVGDVLGQNVLYYYEESQTLSSDGTLLYVTPYKMDGYEITIDAKDVVSVADATVTYKKKNVTKTQRIDAAAKLVYNGRPLYDNIEETLGAVKRGSFRFYDADRDGKYETLCVKSLRDYAVKQYNVHGKYLLFENASPLYITDDVHVQFEMPSGVTAYDASGLTQGHVMTVYISEDGSVIKGHVSNERIHGAVTQVDSDEDGDLVYLDDVEYAVSPYCTSDIRVGNESDFLVNIFGEIVCIVSGTRENEFNLGILTWIQVDEMSEEAQLVIYTSNGINETFGVAEKFILDGVAQRELGNAYRVYRETNVASEEYRGLFGNGVKVRRELIRYKLNDEGKIREIDTSVYNQGREDKYNTLIMLSNGYTSVVDENGFDKKNEIVADKNTGIKSEGQKYVRAIQKLSGNTDVYITEDTEYFTAPADVNHAGNKAYTVQKAVNGFTNGATYWTMTYKESTDEVCASIVVSYNSINEKKSMSGDLQPVVITNIKNIDEDGDIVTSIEYTGLNGKKIQSYSRICRDDEIWQQVKPMVSRLEDDAAANEGYRLARGDLVRVQVNSMGEIEGIELIYRAKEDTMVSKNPSGQSPNGYGSDNKGDYFRLVEGYVLSKKDDFVTISVGEPFWQDGVLTGNSVELHRIDVPILVYDIGKTGSEAVRIGSTADLRAAEEFGTNMSRLFLYTRYAVPGLVFVYDED